MATSKPVYIANRILNATRVAQAADNASVTNWQRTNKFIMVFQVDEAKGPWSAAYYLCWRNVTDGGSFAQLAATGQMKWTTETDLTQGTAVTTRACTTAGASGSSWQNGEEVEASSYSDSINLADEYYTEIHFAVDPADAHDGDQYEFAVYETGGYSSVGTGTGKLTIAAADYPQLFTSALLADSNRNLLTTFGSWATTSALGVERSGGSGCGTTSDALFFGGSTATAVTGRNEKWSGAAWATTVSLAVMLDDLAGCGTTTDALSFGGKTDVDDTYQTQQTTTQKWSGSSWATTADLNTARFSLAGCGTTSAALSICGRVVNISGPPLYVRTDYPVKLTEKWSGAAWATTTDALTARQDLAGFGTTSSALSVGSTATEIWDGSVWATTTAPIYMRDDLAGCGTTTAALNFGGTYGGIVRTEVWDGSSWAITTQCNTARFDQSGCGTASAALNFGGDTGAYVRQSTNEKWTGPTTNITHSMTQKIILATQIGKENLTTSDAQYKLQWRNVTDAGSFADVSSSSQIAWATDSGVLVDGTAISGSTGWTTVSSLNIRRRSHGGCGTVTASLAFGGNTYSGTVDSTEKWSGSSWATTGAMNNATESLSGCGTTTAALYHGGYTTAPFSDKTSIWSGTSWATTSAMVVGIIEPATCGTANDALSAAGLTASGVKVTLTEKWSGTAWATTTNLVGTARDVAAMAGTTSAALIFGGDTNSNNWTAVTEIWSGTAWSTTSSLPAGVGQHAGCGTASAALAFGGWSDSGAQTDSDRTYYWSGASWATTTSLNVARGYGLKGSGNSVDALSFGGYQSLVGAVTTTEKWVGAETRRCVIPELITSWATTSALTEVSIFQAACGTITAALNYGGMDASQWTTRTHKWSGSSWATTSAISQARCYLGGCGTTASALAIGGQTNGDNVTTHDKWSGSSWATTTALSVAWAQGATCGTTAAALYYGGTTSYSVPTGVTRVDIWSGTAWATTTALPQGTHSNGGCGTTSAALSVGGTYSTFASVCIWSGSAWATTTALNEGRYAIEGAGTTTSAVFFGGQSSTFYSHSTEIWGGAVWVTAPDMNGTRSSFGGCGIATSALAMGGSSGASMSSTEKWSPTMTWQDGLESVGDNTAPDAGVFDLGYDSYTEFQWALNPAGGHDGDTYEFRLYNVTGATAVGTCSVTLTLIYYYFDEILGSRFLSDADRSSLERNDVITTVGPSDVILAIALCSKRNTAAGAYKLRWRRWGGWVTTSPLPAVASDIMGFGDLSAAIAAKQLAAWRWSGSSWATTTAPVLNTYSAASAGDANDGLSMGGYEVNGDGYTAKTQKWSGAAWATTTGMNWARNYLGGCGTTSAALSWGGMNASFVTLPATEKWSGSAWATTTDATARQSMAGFGVTSAALSYAGGTMSGYTVIPFSTTFIWSGSAWATTTAGSVAKSAPSGCGTTSAGLAFGGWSGSGGSGTEVRVSDIWSGSVWATTTSLAVPRAGLAGCGSTTSALSFGGTSISGSALNASERWMGGGSYSDVSDTGDVRWATTSAVLTDNATLGTGSKRCFPLYASVWATTTNMASANVVMLHTACGTTAAALSWGGSTGGYGIAVTEKWSGASWANTSTLNIGRRAASGCGTTTAALTYSGINNAGAYTDTTEKWSGSSWANTTAGSGLIQNSGGCGTTSAALHVGGNTGMYIGWVSVWNGSSWATTTALPTGRTAHGCCGTASNAIIAGGLNDTPAYTTEVDIWSGSSWATTTGLNATRSTFGFVGTTASALCFGGSTVSILYTEQWDGSAWGWRSALNAQRQDMPAGAGAPAGALAFGGYTGSYVGPPSTERWFDLAWQDGVENLGDNLFPDGSTLDVALGYYTEVHCGLSFANASADIYQIGLHNTTYDEFIAACNARANVDLTPPATPASRILYDDRSSASSADNASAQRLVKFNPIIFASSLARTGIPSSPAAYKLQWRRMQGWATTSSAPAAKSAGASVGTMLAALHFSGSGTANFSWNNGSWATTSAYNYSVWAPSAGGNVDNALAFGGSSGLTYTTVTSKWSGASWAATNVMSVGRSYIGGFGSTSSMMACGGQTTNQVASPVDISEIWSGSSWATTTALPEVRQFERICGTTTSALLSGGSTDINGNMVASCLIWDGGAWSTTTAIAAAFGKKLHQGAGSTTSCIIWGGTTQSSIASTYKWSGAAWATTTAHSYTADQGAYAGAGDFLAGGIGCLLLSGLTGGVYSGVEVGYFDGSDFTDIASTGEVKWTTTSNSLSDGTALTSGNRRCLALGYSAWRTSAPLTVTRQSRHTMIGTAASALSCGGYAYTTTYVYYNHVEKRYDTVWYMDSALPGYRTDMAGCGTVSAAMLFGGAIEGSAQTETTLIYNGAAWATTASLNNGVYYHAGCGTTTAALSFGGSSGGGNVNKTEVWSGAAWATASALPQIVEYHSGCGTTTTALSIGGMTQSSPGVATVSKWSGSSWATTTSLTAQRNSGAAAGDASSALVVCGAVGSSSTRSTSTERWDGSVWATTSYANLARTGCGGCGSATTALCGGGVTGAGADAQTGSVETWETAEWQNGEENVADNIIPDAGTFTLGLNKYTELQWSVSLEDAIDDLFYEFRVYNATGDEVVGVYVARVSVIAITLSFVMVIDDEIYTE